MVEGTMGNARRPKVLLVFGTRPEVIKLAPVIRQLEARASHVDTVNVTTAQHTDLLYPFVRSFGIRVDHDLNVMRPGQRPTEVQTRVLTRLEPILVRERPDLVLVQGDTTSAVAAALAASRRQIPVGHVEAGLRSGNLASPFPEEMNRRLISRLATDHFAATEGNRDTLIREGVSPDRIFVTGNPVVDALRDALATCGDRRRLREVLGRTQGLRLLVLTFHRRESFGARLERDLRVLQGFVERHDDIALIFPVHPNPQVVKPVSRILAGSPRIHLIEPLGYLEFIALLSQAWLIASDSGGVQEEAPTLGKPLLILRENTERPEVIEAGVARLVGLGSDVLDAQLEEAATPDSWVTRMKRVDNPFGRGDSGERIAGIVVERLAGGLRRAPGVGLQPGSRVATAV
jgi:UDP-N-acetylglucosamine 2-epimerase (non-hydrolysing)